MPTCHPSNCQPRSRARRRSDGDIAVGWRVISSSAEVRARASRSSRSLRSARRSRIALTAIGSATRTASRSVASGSGRLTHNQDCPRITGRATTSPFLTCSTSGCAGAAGRWARWWSSSSRSSSVTSSGPTTARAAWSKSATPLPNTLVIARTTSSGSSLALVHIVTVAWTMRACSTMGLVSRSVREL